MNAMMRGRSRRRRPPGASLALAALAVAAFAVPGLAGRLEYTRDALAAGELWRVVTGHWTHFTTEMLLWDVLAFACLGAVCEIMNRTRFLVCVGVSAPLIPAAIWIFVPELTVYRGLSGLDSALFGLLWMTLLRESIRSRDRRVVVALAVFLVLYAGKLGYEILFDAAFFARNLGSGVEPVPLAHGVGALVGALVALGSPADQPDVARRRAGPVRPSSTVQIGG